MAKLNQVKLFMDKLNQNIFIMAKINYVKSINKIILKFIINVHNYQLNVYYNYNDNKLYIYNKYYIFKFYYLC